MDPELEEMPTDLMRGLDFRITKTTKGGYADYSTSKWARKESALTEAEQAAIEQFGLFDLSEFLPKKPTDIELKVIKEMFEASVDGKPYDPDRWASYYRPAGVAAPAASNKAASDDTIAESHVDVPEVMAKPVVTDASTPFDEEDSVPTASAPVQAKPATTQNAQDILAMIRARQNK